MTHTYKFNDNKWKEDFVYAVGPHTKDRVKYIEENGILRNEYNEKIGDHDYISVISKKAYAPGTTVKAVCTFSGTGAPCFVFANDIAWDDEFSMYGLHFEVCVYVGGVNVWRIEPWPERVERPIRTKKIHFVEWAPNTTELECIIKFGDKKITVSVEDKTFDVEWDEFPNPMHLGFTACEGPCTFHEFTVIEKA